MTRVGNDVQAIDVVQGSLYLRSFCAHCLHIRRPASYITSSHSPSRHFHRTRYSLSDTNHTASRTTARIARRLALLVSALAQIVRAAVHDDRSAQDALRPDQLDLLVRDGALGVPLAVGLEVAEVADVAFAVGWGAVGFGEGVDWEKGRLRQRGVYGVRRGRRGGYSEVRRWYSRWCCRRTGGRACHARPRRRGR